MNSTLELATQHLLKYLANPSGSCVFVYEPSYRRIADDILDRIDTGWVRCVDLAAADLGDLSASIRGEPVCFAFDRRYGPNPPSWQDWVVRESRDRLDMTFTLCDCADRFEDLFAIPPDEITKVNSELLERVDGGSILRAVNDDGTNLSIQLSKQYDWVMIDGFVEREHDLTVNLPPGEIATYPARVDGTVVFRGALLGTIPIGRKYGLIEDPITLQIEQSVITRIDAPSPSMQADLEFCLKAVPYADHVCEIGLGTHPAIRSLTGLNYSFEEKHLGFHIGFGASLAQQNVERVTHHHLDMMFAEIRLDLDGAPLFSAGDYHTA
jgi:leucyl aminopeptidase (aminopeptidase T)